MIDEITLLESQVEQKIASKISEVITDFDIITSWKPSTTGTVKGEDGAKNGIISLFISPRVHQDFSLPMIDLNGTLCLEVKSEKSPNMALVSATYQKIANLFSTWHYNSTQFSEDISTDNFFAAELKISGSDKVTFDRNSKCWLVTISFTIRGSEIFN